MRFSENLKEDGTLDTMSAGSDHVQRDEFVSRGQGGGDFEPRFTWHCFRYAEITGWPQDAPSGNEVEAKSVYMDTPVTGDFFLFQSSLRPDRRTFRATQFDQPTWRRAQRLSHRERLGYTGDGQITAEAVMWNFDVASF